MRLLLSAVCLALCLSQYYVTAKSLQTFRNEFFSSFSTFRKANGLKALKTSTTLNNGAQKWAQELANTGKWAVNQNLNGKFIWQLVGKNNGGDYTNGNSILKTWAGNWMTKATLTKTSISQVGFGKAKVPGKATYVAVADFW